MKSQATHPKPTPAVEPAPMSHDDVRAILRSAAADLRAIIGKLEPITNGGHPPVPTGAYEADGSDESLMVDGVIPKSLDFHFRTAILPGDLGKPEGYSYPTGEYCLGEIAWHFEQVAAATAATLEHEWRECVRSSYVAKQRATAPGRIATQG